MTDKKKGEKSKKGQGKSKKPANSHMKDSTAPGSDASENSQDYGGMNLDNFRKNMGCGG